MARSWPALAAVAGLALVGLQAARSAYVAAEGEKKPEAARRVWPSHPVPLQTIALRDIGAAAARGQSPSADTLALIERSALTAPLNPQPLLVAATERLAAGDQAKGRQLLEAAVHRDPRSTAAHFLLADLAVRQQRLGDALVHVAVLQRRLGGGVEGFAGALADYAKQPGAPQRLAPVLGNASALRTAMLTRLAGDPAGGQALLALVRRGDAAQPWFVQAVRNRAAAGDVAGARQLMARAGQPTGGQRLAAWSPQLDAVPFGWAFLNGPEGVAEPVLNGPVRLVYYGRAEAVLANHPLLLAPGRYRLDAGFTGSLPEGLFEWRMVCLPSGRILSAQPATGPAHRQLFAIPAECPAQRLELRGRMGDFPRTVSTELLRASLTPEGAGS